jgi:hypothetical protein
LPGFVIPVFLAASLAGTIADNNPRHITIKYTIIFYMILFCFFGKQCDFYWGWICAPLLSFGFSRFLTAVIPGVGWRFDRSPMVPGRAEGILRVCPRRDGHYC